jgi:hypothetical protein
MIYHRQSHEDKDRAAMLKQISEYTDEVKRLQHNVRSYPLKIVIANLRVAIQDINRDIKLSENRGDLQTKFRWVKALLLNGNHYETAGNRYTWSSRPVLEEAQFLRPYIASDLYQEIHSIGQGISYFGNPNELLEGIWEMYDSWVNSGNALIKDIELLIPRLELLLKEMK